MPEPTPDAVPPVGADGNRDLDRYAKGSLEPGLVVAQANLYVSAVESGGEGTRRVGRGLGIGAWLAIGWLAFIVIVAVLAQLGVLPLKDPNRSYVSCARRGPFSTDGTASGFLLGCDSNGRDMIARLAYGSWSSLIVATGAVLFGLVFGGTFGLIAGYFGRRTDAVITSLFNVFLAIPAVVLALALVAFLAGAAASTGQSSVDPKLILILAIGIVSIPLLGRITRASALSWSQREFVLAARAQGAKPVRIMLREVLPNVLPAMFSIALLGIAVAIVAEGTLSILGVGVRPPTPSWGNIIGLDRGRLKESPHIIFLPALMIFFTVLSLNFLGDVVRARLDVRESAV